MLTKNLKLFTYGKKSLKYLVAFDWNKLHNDIKQAETLNIFKISLNKWKVECKCNLALYVK